MRTASVSNAVRLVAHVLSTIYKHLVAVLQHRPGLDNSYWEDAHDAREASSIGSAQPLSAPLLEEHLLGSTAGETTARRLGLSPAEARDVRDACTRVHDIVRTCVDHTRRSGRDFGPLYPLARLCGTFDPAVDGTRASATLAARGAPALVLYQQCMDAYEQACRRFFERRALSERELLSAHSDHGLVLWMECKHGPVGKAKRRGRNASRSKHARPTESVATAVYVHAMRAGGGDNEWGVETAGGRADGGAPLRSVAGAPRGHGARARDGRPYVDARSKPLNLLCVDRRGVTHFVQMYNVCVDNSSRDARRADGVLCMVGA